MPGNAENISSALNTAATTKATTGIGVTITAGGVVATAENPYIVGEYLARHGPQIITDYPILSWVELFQIVGSVFVTYQLIKIIISGLHSAYINIGKLLSYYRKFKRKPIKIKPKGATNATNSKT